MFKQAYPDKYLFAGRHGDIYRAYMFQCGGFKTIIERKVPNYLTLLGDTGGLFDCFRTVNLLLSLFFFDPIDMMEFFYAMQELVDGDKERIHEDKFIQYF